MRLGRIVKGSFLISLLITIIGVYLKITHSESTEIFLIIGIMATLIFIVSAIYEVRTSTRIGNREKTMWTVAFIFMSGLAGLIYFFNGRMRIATVFSVTSNLFRSMIIIEAIRDRKMNALYPGIWL